MERKKMENQRAIAGRVTSPDQVKKRRNKNKRCIKRWRDLADTIHVEIEDGEEEYDKKLLR